MEHDGWTYIYLTGQRKAFSHDTVGWETMAYERFEYVECGVFRKRTAELTEFDKVMAETHGEPGQSFITPSDWREPTAQVPASLKIEGTHRLIEANVQPALAYPLHIGLPNAPGPNVTVTLHADGTWTGDRAKWADALAALRGQFGLNAAVFWLVLRQLTPETERKP